MAAVCVAAVTPSATLPAQTTAFSAWHSRRERRRACAKALGRVLKRGLGAGARRARVGRGPYRGTDSTGPIVGGLYADEVVGFVRGLWGCARDHCRGRSGCPSYSASALLPALALGGVLALLFLGLGP